MVKTSWSLGQLTKAQNSEDTMWEEEPSVRRHMASVSCGYSDWLLEMQRKADGRGVTVEEVVAKWIAKEDDIHSAVTSVPPVEPHATWMEMPAVKQFIKSRNVDYGYWLIGLYNQAEMFGITLEEAVKKWIATEEASSGRKDVVGAGG